MPDVNHDTWDHTGVPGVGGSFRGCKIYNDGAQSIPNASSTAVTFGAEMYDTDALHSTATDTSRITIPSGLAGKWRFTYKTGFAANGTGARVAFLRRNGGTDANNILGSRINVMPISATLAADSGHSVDVDLAVGDYVELFLYQDSGGALNSGVAATSPADVNTLSAQFLGS